MFRARLLAVLLRGILTPKKHVFRCGTILQDLHRAVIFSHHVGGEISGQILLGKGRGPYLSANPVTEYYKVNSNAVFKSANENNMWGWVNIKYGYHNKKLKEAFSSIPAIELSNLH